MLEWRHEEATAQAGMSIPSVLAVTENMFDWRHKELYPKPPQCQRWEPGRLGSLAGGGGGRVGGGGLRKREEGGINQQHTGADLDNFSLSIADVSLITQARFASQNETGSSISG